MDLDKKKDCMYQISKHSQTKSSASARPLSSPLLELRGLLLILIRIFILLPSFVHVDLSDHHHKKEAEAAKP